MVTKEQKLEALKKSIEIAKEFGHASAETRYSPDVIIKECYEEIVKILTKIEQEK